MTSYYDNSDLVNLADKVKDLYKNPEITNYVHNGKKLPIKYKRLFERSLVCSNIQGEKSLYVILTNAIKYSFSQAIQINNSTELRMYRETSERSKLVLASYNRKLELGDKSIISEIEKKEEELKLIQKKIDEIATLSTLKPEINKNILNTAEEAYNILLRTDKTPYYFYLEICRKLGKRVNLDQQFTGFRDKDKPNNKNFKKDDKKDDSDDEDYRNYLEMNVKKSAYVPPAFRKNNLQDKLSRVDNIIKKEEEEQTKIIKNEEKEKEKEKAITQVELFPTLNLQKNTESKQTTKVQLGAWGKKLVIEKAEEPKEENNKQENKEENILTNTTDTTPIVTTSATLTTATKEEWGESAWETMEEY